MIKASNAIRTARSLIGTPYSEMDCIRLIVMVIRRTSGGDADYRCEGTNWLWRSIKNSSKYRHLTWQQESIEGAKAGMLAFKRDGDDVHHVGLVTERGTVIHSSSVKGMVVETALDSTWHLLGRHKLIEPAEAGHGDAEAGVYIGRMPQETREEQSVSFAAKNAGHTAYTSLVRSDGVSILLAGSWRVEED